MRIHNKIGGLVIKNGKLLMCRKIGEPHFILPGGRPIGKETTRQTLARELLEETGSKLVGKIKKFKTWEARHFREKDMVVRMKTYFAQIKGVPKARGEIVETKWIDSSYKNKGIKLASINVDHTIPELKKLKLIK